MRSAVTMRCRSVRRARVNAPHDAPARNTPDLDGMRLAVDSGTLRHCGSRAARALIHVNASAPCRPEDAMPMALEHTMSTLDDDAVGRTRARRRDFHRFAGHAARSALGVRASSCEASR